MTVGGWSATRLAADADTRNARKGATAWRSVDAKRGKHGSVIRSGTPRRKEKSSVTRKRIRVSGRECVGAVAKRLLTDNGKLHRPEGDVCDCRAGRDQTRRHHRHQPVNWLPDWALHRCSVAEGVRRPSSFACTAQTGGQLIRRRLGWSSFRGSGRARPQSSRACARQARDCVPLRSIDVEYSRRTLCSDRFDVAL
jgi:hypothetical protein